MIERDYQPIQCSKPEQHFQQDGVKRIAKKAKVGPSDWQATLINVNDLRTANIHFTPVTRPYDKQLTSGRSTQQIQLKYWAESSQQMWEHLDSMDQELDQLQQFEVKGGLEDQLMDLMRRNLNFSDECVYERNQIRNQFENEADIDNPQPIKDISNMIQEMQLEIESLEKQEQTAIEINTQIKQQRQEQEAKEELVQEQLKVQLQIQAESDNQNYAQNKLLWNQQFNLRVIQEQYYSHKRVPRTCCLFNGGHVVYDETFQCIMKQVGQKQWIYKMLEQLPFQDKENIPQKSKSHAKVSPRPQILQLKFEFQFSPDQEGYTEILTNLDLFIKGSMYKRIDLFHKNLSANSEEYYMLYNSGVGPQYKHIQKYQSQENNSEQYNHNTILILSDKNRGFIHALMEGIVKALNGFDNGMVRVESLKFSCYQITQGKKCLLIDKYPVEYFFNQISNLKLYDSEHYLIEVQIFMKDSSIKVIDILTLSINRIESLEQFARGFKQAYRREKGINILSGTDLEKILRQTEKLAIILEFPYMVKQDTQYEDLLKLQSIFELYNQITTR